jgi:peroxiredoxin Q/BCP
MMMTAMALAFLFPSEPAAPKLKVGDAAPAFSLPGSNGKTVQLSDFLGKKKVILAFYPKAFTGG